MYVVSCHTIVLLPVEVLDLAREPGHGLGVVLGVPGDGLVVAGLVLDGRQRTLDVSHRGVDLLILYENLLIYI